ncbi:MAG: hypothetical protein U9R19_11575 [Bacteroidota bacterium]|nr:hypothetical protein [Bacteroidota bacterium]
MNKTFITLLLVGLFIVNHATINGQEVMSRFVGVESGINYQACESTNYDFIRGTVDVSTFGINDDVNSLNMSFEKWYFGIKSEYRFKENKVGLLYGIRFSQVNSSLSKSTTYASSTTFFYLLNKQESTTTEFLKVKEIIQSSNYLGVPIELKYYLFNIISLRFYIKGSAEISYRLSTNTNVVFHNSEMEAYESEVADKFDKPNNLLVMLYGAGGIKIGKDSNVNLSIETHVPSIILTNNVSGLVNPIAGTGFQINIQIPF